MIPRLDVAVNPPGCDPLGEPDRVNLSEMAYTHAKNNPRFVFEEREEPLECEWVTSGLVRMWWVTEKEGSDLTEGGGGDAMMDLSEAMNQYAMSTQKMGNYNDAANLLFSKVARSKEGVQYFFLNSLGLGKREFDRMVCVRLGGGGGCVGRVQGF